MPAQIALSIAAVPTALPLEDAPIGVQHDLSNAAGAGGWTDVDEVTWTLLTPEGSAAAMSVASPIVAAPFDNDFTPDVPGTYTVHLHITYLDSSTSTDRCVICVVDPYTRVALPGIYELGADPDDASPNPTRDATHGWGRVDMSAKRALALGALSTQKRLVVFNNTGGAVGAGVVCNLLTHIVYKGRVADGVAPAMAYREFVPTIAVADGTDPDSVGYGTTLVYIPEAIANGEYGAAILAGLIVANTAPMAAGDLMVITGAGNLSTPMDLTMVNRPVAMVHNPALNTADPPGGFWFDGRDPGFPLESGAVETPIYVEAQDAGAPVWGAVDPGAGVGQLPFRQLTSAANNDDGRRTAKFHLIRPLSLWPDQAGLFRFSIRSNSVAQVTPTLEIYDAAFNALFAAPIAWTVGNNVWQDVVITRAMLGFPGANVELGYVGQEFNISVRCLFGAAAGAGTTFDHSSVRCGAVA